MPAGPDGKFAVEPTKGLLCAALFNDGLFYRARVEAVAGSAEEPEKQSCLVTFIDYGNQSEVSGFVTLAVGLPRCQDTPRGTLRVPLTRLAILPPTPGELRVCR